jgi:hypothetical protein
VITGLTLAVLRDAEKAQSCYRTLGGCREPMSEAVTLRRKAVVGGDADKSLEYPVKQAGLSAWE